MFRLMFRLMFRVSRSRPKGVRAATGISVSAWKEKVQLHGLHVIRVQLMQHLGNTFGFLFISVYLNRLLHQMPILVPNYCRGQDTQCLCHAVGFTGKFSQELCEEGKWHRLSRHQGTVWQCNEASQYVQYGNLRCGRDMSQALRVEGE